MRPISLILSRRERVEPPRLEQRDALVAVVEAPDPHVHRLVLDRGVEALLGGRSLEHPDPLAGEVGEAGDARVGLDGEAARVDEHEVGEVDLLHPRLRRRRVGAVELGLAGGDHRDAVGGGADDPVHLEVGDARDAPEVRDHPLAQVDRVAGRRVPGGDVRERQRIPGKRDGDLLGRADLAQRVRGLRACRRGGRHGQHGRRGGQRDGTGEDAAHVAPRRPGETRWAVMQDRAGQPGSNGGQAARRILQTGSERDSTVRRRVRAPRWPIDARPCPMRAVGFLRGAVAAPSRGPRQPRAGPARGPLRRRGCVLN